MSLIGNYCDIKGIKTITDEKKLSDILIKNNLNDVSDIRMVNLPFYFTYVIYVRNAGLDYAIPFTKREDLLDIKSGSVYKMSELIKTLDSKFFAKSLSL